MCIGFMAPREKWNPVFLSQSGAPGERFLTDAREGLFLGPEVGVSRLEVVCEESGIRQDRVHYSIGLRLGYRRYLGLGNLYLSPVVGLVHSLNARDFEFDQATFEVGSLTPFVTLGIGWTFGSGP
jgi:hypothetical protein